MPEIIILGAGLTGLSAAYHLEQAGFFDYKIFEKNDRPGGLLRSVQQDGFTFDYTGHLLHISNSYFKELLDTIVGLKNFDLNVRQSAIHSHNTQVNFPFQMNLHGLPEDVVYECVKGFIERKTSIRQPKTFYQWVLKYFGAGIGKYFFFPYNGKILAYDVKKVTPSWTGRFVPQVTLKDVLSGALYKRSAENIGYNSSFFYPKRGGIEIIIQKFIENIKSTIHTNHNATHIDLKNNVVHFANGHKESYKYLISTLPLNELLGQAESGTRTTFKHASKKLICNSVVNFNIGFDVEKLSEKHWLYFPEKKYPFYRIGFWNNISAASTKTGCSAIYGETSYQPHITTKKQEEKILEQSIHDALQFLSLNKSNIVTKNILHLKHAYVTYDLWREKNIKKLHQRLNDYNVHSIGRFGEWKYSSMQEAVLDGQQTSEQLLSHLTHNKNQTILPAKHMKKKCEKRKEKVIQSL